MKVEVAVLADYASVSTGNKLSIAGIFDSITAVQFPAIHPVMYLVLRLGLEFEDGNRTHKLAVVMRDEDSGEFFRADAEIAVERIAPGEVTRMNQLMHFVGLQFAQPGKYFFHVNWNGGQVALITLSVRMPGA